MPKQFTGEIKVAARIIDYLSSGLYPNAAACLKELINNSYDADAKRVDVFVKPDADQIVIVDDGIGFTKSAFIKHFESLAESHKRDDSEKTKHGRPKIGKIGIGFIAANELCEEMEIFSTTRGSTDLLHVTIDFSEMRKPIEDRRREGDTLVKADFTGEVLTTEANEHYTQIFLKNIRGEAQEVLVSANRAKPTGKALSLYGLTPESISAKLADPALKSWDDFDFYSQNMLRVALNVPVSYLDDWVPAADKRRMQEFEDAVNDLKFNVYYDGTELRKPIKFTASRNYFFHKFKFEGKLVSARGYFFARHGTIEPHELQGLLVRIRNSSVGDYDSSFWKFSQTEASLIQRWVSCEIWASDELEEAMNIDRATLRETHPAYVELRDAIHSDLRKVLVKAKSDIYQTASDKRKSERAATANKELRRIADDVVQKVSPRAAEELKSHIGKSRREAIDPLQKLTVSEIYGIIVDIAKDLLPPPLFIKFLSALNDRLGGGGS